MGAGHAPSLHLHGHTRLHRLAPECKVLAVLAFVLLVVLTPREQFWAFGGYAMLLLAVTRLGNIPPTFVLKRLMIEAPFVAFALLIPFFHRGERIEVAWFTVSEPGLLAAFNILTKATLGAAATIVLAASTPVRDLLAGLERLGLHRGFVSIASFMVRYVDVIIGDMQRMKVARASRAYNPRNALQARALGASVGALFIRSYERGERVHLAMVSRGYTGALPELGTPRAGPADWAQAALLPLAAALICAGAWLRA